MAPCFHHGVLLKSFLDVLRDGLLATSQAAGCIPTAEETVVFDELKKKLEAHLERDLGIDDLKAKTKHVVDFLEASEYQLILLMNHNGLWPKPLPPEPGGEGDCEFGLFPYWINHPADCLEKDIDRVVRYVLELLGDELTSHIDKEDHDRLVEAAEDGGIVAGDGTMWGTEKYQQIDPGWVLSLIYYIPTHFLNSRAKFSTRDVQPIKLSGRSADEVKIAMVGDWGTGDYPHLFAVAVMDQIEALRPDYIIHLGDVYYAGTDSGLIHKGEEQKNFVNLWPKDIPSFTMNSNHEMYDGARGYFEVALAAKPFAQQQQTSYFALQYAGWTLIGLDSCYWSKSPLFMTGSLGGGEDTTQADWIRRLGVDADKTIVMTHHNGLTYQGNSEPEYNGVSLWSEVNAALGGDPAAWYWGHIHNAMVYKNPTFNGKQTRARCLGHGALPFGDAWGIQDQPEQIKYYAHTPNSEASPRHMRNGFAVLTMKSDGQVTEEFFDQGNTTAMYTETYSQR